MGRMKMFAICATLSGALMLSACASGGLFDTPQDSLNTVSAAVGLAEAAYDSMCSQPTPPPVCTNPADVSAYNASKIAVEAALQSAQAAINLSGNVNNDTIQQLIATLESDYNAYNNIVQTAKAKAAREGGRIGN